MTTRRSFLKAGTAAATGIVFCSCGLLERAHAQGTSRTLPVAVNGRPARCSAPTLPPFRCHRSTARPRPSSRSTSGWYGRDRELAGQIVKLQNEKLAELCASKPDRFAAFASFTLQAPDLAVQELEEGGLKGAAIGGAVAGTEFSDPKFHPVWAKAEELGVPSFIHPQGVPKISKRQAGNGWLGNTIGNPLETTIALSRLIFEGTLDKFPGLKVIAAHGGGYLPSCADRSEHACMVGPAGCKTDIKLQKKPSEYLKRPRSAPTRSCWAATIPGSSSRLTISSPAIRSATGTRSRCWAARRRGRSALRVEASPPRRSWEGIFRYPMGAPGDLSCICRVVPCLSQPPALPPVCLRRKATPKRSTARPCD